MTMQFLLFKHLLLINPSILFVAGQKLVRNGLVSLDHLPPRLPNHQFANQQSLFASTDPIRQSFIPYCDNSLKSIDSLVLCCFHFTLESTVNL